MCGDIADREMFCLCVRTRSVSVWSIASRGAGKGGISTLLVLLRERACVWSGDGGELMTFDMETRLVTDREWRPRERAASTWAYRRRP